MDATTATGYTTGPGLTFANDTTLDDAYQTPDASRLLNFNEENFQYFDKIEKKNLNDEYEKHLFFGSNTFKNFKVLIKILLFFYRLIHLKSKKLY